MDDERRRPRRQIRNYLLDRGVQLRVSLVMVALSTVLTAGLGLYWYMEMRGASEVIRVNALTTLGHEGASQLAAQLAAQDATRLWLLIGFAVLFALLIAAYGIVMTHRIAGPLFKIGRHMNDIANGRLYPLWGLRKGDLLQDFFDAFEVMHGALRDRTEADMDMIRELIEAIEGRADLSPQLARLKQALITKGDSLRGASGVTQRIMRPPS